MVIDIQIFTDRCNLVYFHMHFIFIFENIAVQEIESRIINTHFLKIPMVKTINAAKGSFAVFMKF